MKTLTITYHDGDTVEYEGQSIEIRDGRTGGLTFSILDGEIADTLHVAAGAWRSYEVNGETDLEAIMAHASALVCQRSHALAGAFAVIDFVARGETPEDQAQRMSQCKGDLARAEQLTLTPAGPFVFPTNTPDKEEPAPNVAP